MLCTFLDAEGMIHSRFHEHCSQEFGTFMPRNPFESLHDDDKGAGDVALVYSVLESDRSNMFMLMFYNRHGKLSQY